MTPICPSSLPQASYSFICYIRSPCSRYIKCLATLICRKFGIGQIRSKLRSAHPHFLKQVTRLFVIFARLARDISNASQPLFVGSSALARSGASSDLPILTSSSKLLGNLLYSLALLAIYQTPRNPCKQVAR